VQFRVTLIKRLVASLGGLIGPCSNASFSFSSSMKTSLLLRVKNAAAELRGIKFSKKLSSPLMGED
jgi:phage FluMu protein gp41